MTYLLNMFHRSRKTFNLLRTHVPVFIEPTLALRARARVRVCVCVCVWCYAVTNENEMF